MLKLTNLGLALEQKGLGGGILSGNLTATITLVTLIMILVGLTIPTILVPVFVHTRNVANATQIDWFSAVFFASIGAGFMCVEIALLQRLSLFLGHPVYGLGILLFSVIASTGVGSLMSELLPANRRAVLVGQHEALAAI